jgi:hypothetical protein
MMPRFYFNFHNADGILIDDDGEELASALNARKVALEIIGETVEILRIATMMDRP